MVILINNNQVDFGVSHDYIVIQALKHLDRTSIPSVKQKVGYVSLRASVKYGVPQDLVPGPAVIV